MARPHRDPDPRSLIGHFGSELRHLRSEADLSTHQLAAALGYTPQWISQVELGDATPSEQFAGDLDTYFATSGSFHRLWRNIKKAVRTSALLPGFPRYLELEAQATFIRRYSTQAVPGLLQTAAYARAVMSLGWLHPPSEDRVDVRMERQVILEGSDPTRSIFVLDESILHRPFGGHAVMHEQLARLLAFEESDDVQIYVLPYRAATAAGLDGAFTMLSFAGDSDVMYSEAPGISQLIEDRNAVNQCAIRFNLLLGEALPRSESGRLIRSVREQYE